MTKETKVKIAYDRYEAIKKDIANLYDQKFNRLSVNDCGEVSANDLLNLNCWYTEEINKAENNYISEIKAIFEQ